MLLTCKHGDLVNVLKAAVSFTFEASPEVSHKDLGALVEVYGFAFKSCLVTETGEAIDKGANKRSSGACCFFDTGREATFKMLIT